MYTQSAIVQQVLVEMAVTHKMMVAYTEIGRPLGGEVWSMELSIDAK